jgi:N-acetylneuraminate synthase/pseudaminic acid synthase
MVRIGDRVIGEDQAVYIIAELSANHGGDINRAKEIIRQAKAAGADAVKLQTYRADTITLDCSHSDFRLPQKSAWVAHETLYSLYEKAHTPWEWHQALFDEAKSIGIDIFSSPFDATAVDLLESLGAPAYKIASPEITDIPLLKYVARTGKPVILSTGIATLEDIELAVATLRNNGCDDLVILKCTTAYPTPYEECNLLTIPDLAKRFSCIAGLSDHTLGLASPITATALGAKVIEKHFILDKTHDSVDGFFSLDEQEFRQMVTEVRNAEKALGKVSYQITAEAQKNMLARRSLYFSKSMKAGDVITESTVLSVRPGFGLHPKYYEQILGLKVVQDVEFGDRVSAETIQGFEV